MSRRMADWSVTIPKLKTCDLCAHIGRDVQSFTLVHSAYKDGRRQSRSAGSVYLCQTCWEKVAAPRRHRSSGPRPELSAAMLQSAATLRTAVDATIATAPRIEGPP
jgi:hypothetical protein